MLTWTSSKLLLSPVRISPQLRLVTLRLSCRSPLSPKRISPHQVRLVPWWLSWCVATPRRRCPLALRPSPLIGRLGTRTRQRHRPRPLAHLLIFSLLKLTPCRPDRTPPTRSVRPSTSQSSFQTAPKCNGRWWTQGRSSPSSPLAALSSATWWMILSGMC
jgi:hypothetical protein